ncbi:hypothetical protein C5167_026508 [Papaver somniferum]|uniref:uncharacterized protein C23H3.12c-like isoform X1 n=1 Tax=Papaver somniferum TaxID=3469 RepID=UPI000E70426F|nr:uncharacterized protein C23H3.12c-like isoform X1 [Papaver somniferum]RZC85840.1 hypothetical protein C5167_026508 [Papaver somniferum]
MKAARLIVFPIKGRNWCFSRSIEQTVQESEATKPSPKFKDLYKKITSKGKPMNQNVEIITEFFSTKMNKAWAGLGEAPEGSIKNKIHGLGVKLLARVKPSEIFLKSISKDVTNVEITYPTSLNPRLVRRRLRHIAFRGSVIHRRYFYGSVSLLPLTAACAILPLPNIPFFWTLFRTYSHWRALQGSERLLVLVSDGSTTVKEQKRDSDDEDEQEHKSLNALIPQWVLHPSEDLDKYLQDLDEKDGLSKSVVSKICKAYHLDTQEVDKYRCSM